MRAAYLDYLGSADLQYRPTIDDAVRTPPPPANGTLIVTTPPRILGTGYVLDAATLAALAAFIVLLAPHRRATPLSPPAPDA